MLTEAVLKQMPRDGSFPGYNEIDFIDDLEVAMPKLRLDFACWNYDRIAPLTDGSVQPEGIELNWLNTFVGETFWRMNRFRHFQVSEFSLASYLMARDRGFPRLTAIPVFVSRLFRHSAIYINRHSGIGRPQDLRGKRIGTREYHVSANVWIRGMLQHEYGVHPAEMQWFTGGHDKPVNIKILDHDLPPEIRIQPIGPEQTLNDMLEAGELDAVIGPRAPGNFYKPDTNIVRLFHDFVSVEQDYYRHTGLFPIMHLIVIRDELPDQYPWVASSLFNAFAEAKNRVYDGFMQDLAVKATVPWLAPHIEQTKLLMGEDFWPYGIEKNRKTLDTVIAYAYEQGLIKRKFPLEEVFVMLND